MSEIIDEFNLIQFRYCHKVPLMTLYDQVLLLFQVHAENKTFVSSCEVFSLVFCNFIGRKYSVASSLRKKRKQSLPKSLYCTLYTRYVGSSESHWKFNSPNLPTTCTYCMFIVHCPIYYTVRTLRTLWHKMTCRIINGAIKNDIFWNFLFTKSIVYLFSFFFINTPLNTHCM